ncbi:MAG: 30S ribosomal protein S21 [Candidatus Cloacimonetes bacterium]|nr:30S ribosomal protein S21 [Candidatus Cloacimonadota bacterium]
MSLVISRQGESFEITLKRFKKKIERAAILSEIKKHQRYEKPSVEKRRKENAAKRKIVKNARKMAKFMK